MPLLLMLTIPGTFTIPTPTGISGLALRDQAAPFFLERHLERAARSGQQGLHSFVRYAQHLADFDLAHALVVKERDRQPLPLGQRLQRRLYARAKFALGEMAHLCRGCARL